MQGAVQTAPPCMSRARQPPMTASEPTLGTGRGAQLASPGQRALPAPCDSRLWARSRLFGHGESGARAGWAAPPFPARARPPRRRCSVPAGGSGVVERPGCGLRGCGAAGQGRTVRTRSSRLPGGARDAAFSAWKVSASAGTPHPVGNRTA